MLKRVSVFILFAAFAIPTAAQNSIPNLSNPAISEFEINGLKVIVKRRAAAPTISAGLFVRGGVRNQKPEQAGIESLALNVAAEGSRKFPREALRRELSRTGSIIGASSGYDYGVISMSSTRPNFDRTWEIFTDIVLNPAFAQADFDQVRDRAITGLRNRGISPDDALVMLETRTLYAGHPYGADPTGTVETIGKLTLNDLKSYHRSLLQTSRLLLVIVGDIDPAEFRKQATASFGSLPRGTYRDTPIEKLAFAIPTVDVTQRPVQTNYVKGVFAAPSLADPDYYAMRVAITILQSRVYQEVRGRLNLSYAPNAEMDDNAANTANIYVTSVEPNRAVTAMIGEINAMRTELIDPDQYDGIAGYFLTTYYLQHETNAAQVRELARYELLGGGWRRSLNFIDEIQKVTPEDVRRVSVKYMKNLRFFVIGDPAAIDRQTFLKTTFASN